MEPTRNWILQDARRLEKTDANVLMTIDVADLQGVLREAEWTHEPPRGQSLLGIPIEPGRLLVLPECESDPLGNVVCLPRGDPIRGYTCWCIKLPDPEDEEPDIQWPPDGPAEAPCVLQITAGPPIRISCKKNTCSKDCRLKIHVEKASALDTAKRYYRRGIAVSRIRFSCACE